MIRVAILTTDSREHYRDHKNPTPYFGTAPEALLQGLAMFPELEIHVLSCLQKPVSSPEKLAPNTWYHGLHVPNVGWMKTAYQGCIRAVRAKLKEIQPNIVHGQGTERDCAISAVFSGFPNVVTIHGNMAELARFFRARIGSFGWLAARLETATLRRTAGVFCNSDYTESLVRPRARKTWQVPNPLRQSFFEIPTPETRPDKCILVNVGVISERKRQVELLEMAEKIHRKGLKFELQFIGHANPEAPYAAAFLQKIQIAEKEGYARYLGIKSSSELITCFDQAAGLVHFPSEEAFGLVVAEGLSRNLRFFGARIGGIPDIADAVPGAELFTTDDWDELGSAISNWINSGFPKASEGAAKMQQRYAPQVIARRHLEIYRDVLSKSS